MGMNTSILTTVNDIHAIYRRTEGGNATVTSPRQSEMADHAIGILEAKGGTWPGTGSLSSDERWYCFEGEVRAVKAGGKGEGWSEGGGDQNNKGRLRKLSVMWPATKMKLTRIPG